MANDQALPVSDLPDGDLISAEIRKEKSARQSKSLTMHRWWAVRPPIVARIAAYLALVDDPEIDAGILRGLAKRTPTSSAIAAAHSRIRDAAWRRVIRSNQGTAEPNAPPVIRVLDPFAGSGAIPAEASRLGCDVYAGDLSPVAYSILRCVLSFPQSFVSAAPRLPVSGQRRWAGLAAELAQAAERVEQRVLQRIKPFFSASTRTPESFWWCRTISCPSCARPAPAIERIPLGPRDDDSQIFVQADDGQLIWKLGNAPRKIGDRLKWRCVFCNAIASRSEARLTDPAASILVAVEHEYRAKPSIELVGLHAADLSWIPSDSLAKELPSLRNECPALTTAARIGGQFIGRRTPLTFSDLFTHRQLFVGLTFVAEVKRELGDLEREGATAGQLDALRHYLAFLTSAIADRNSIMCDVQARIRGATTSFTYAAYRQASAFVERFPSGMVADWLDRLLPAIESAADLPAAKRVYCGPANALPFETDHFDAVVTDPPYYDRIPYSDLADFYYVWESAVLGSAESQSPSTGDPSAFESQSAAETENSHRAGMLASFQEIHRVLRPGGTLCLLFSGPSASGFKEYLDLCQQAGLEFINIQKLPDIERRQLSKIETVTLLVYLRKPTHPTARAPLVAMDAEKLIDSATAGKPVLYAGLASLLDTQLDPATKAELIPEGSKGSVLEQLMEVVGDEDPRDLLQRSFGKHGVRLIAQKLGASDEQLARSPLEYILEYFGFGVPPSVQGREGAKALSDRLHQLAAGIKQADNRSTITGTFLDACAKIELILRFGIWSWAEFVFGNERDKELSDILKGGDPNKHIALDRLSFGHIAFLFRKLPDRIAQSSSIAIMEQKLGRRHVYVVGGKQKLGDRVDQIVTWRNKVEHNKDNYRDGTALNPLKRDLATVLQDAVKLVDDLAEVGAIPCLAVPFEEIRDKWNRLKYRLAMDYGTDLTIRSSQPMALGRQYIYLGTETNPTPVDPMLLELERIGPLS